MDIDRTLEQLIELCDVLSEASRYGHDGNARAERQARAAALAEGLRVEPTVTARPEPQASGLQAAVSRATELALRGADELATAGDDPEAVITTMRAARYVAYVMELTYPYAHEVERLGNWFALDGEPPARAQSFEDTGVAHLSNERDSKGGCSLYVPESYDPNGPPLPLVIALHGGAGHGRTFLWSWLREARSRNFIVLSPTSVGDTWSLMQPDIDIANIQRMVDWLVTRWHVDQTRILLTGMSDGGTFSLLGGLQAGFPCTHLAPVSASFHPMMLEMVDSERVRQTPLHLTHGRFDWMFPVTMAADAKKHFAHAGASVELTVVDDLAHTYPREQNIKLYEWFCATSASDAAS